MEEGTLFHHFATRRLNLRERTSYSKYTMAMLAEVNETESQGLNRIYMVFSLVSTYRRVPMNRFLENPRARHVSCSFQVRVKDALQRCFGDRNEEEVFTASHWPRPTKATTTQFRHRAKNDVGHPARYFDFLTLLLLKLLARVEEYRAKKEGLEEILIQHLADFRPRWIENVAPQVVLGDGEVVAVADLRKLSHGLRLVSPAKRKNVYVGLRT